MKLETLLGPKVPFRSKIENDIKETWELSVD